MFTQTGRLVTPDSKLFLRKLCLHFQKKIAIEFNEIEGVATFQWGRCRMVAQENALCLQCEAESAAQLFSLWQVVDAHAKLLARSRALPVVWDELAQR